MSQINAYLMFNGNCREAMEFYKSVFGGELTLMTMGEVPNAAPDMPAEAKNKIMHSHLMKDANLLLMASDSMDANDAKHGTSITLSFGCATEEEFRSTFAKMSEGGKVTHELKVEFWGDIFGTVTDKFGFSWMFNHQAAK